MSTYSPTKRDEADTVAEEPPASDRVTFQNAVSRGLGLVYDKSFALVVLSLLWFVASLPIVTIGPATVGAYAAILSIRDKDYPGVDREMVVDALWKQFVPSVALGLLPIFFGGISAFYLTRPSGGSFTYALGLLAGYIAIYLSLVLMPTFVELARGEEPIAALRTGVAWVSSHPGPSLALGTITLLLFVASAVLTVALPLLFAGIAFTIQVEVVVATDEDTADADVDPA